MAVPRSLKNATVTLTDTDGANTLTLTLEDGNLNFTVPNPHEHVADRGAPGTLIDGGFEPITFTMDVQWTSLTSAANVQEVVYGTAGSWVFTKVTTGSGSYSGKTASLQDAATAVKLFQMKVAVADPGGGSTENLFFLDCVLDTGGFTEGMPNKFTITGICYLTQAAFMANIA